MNNFKKAFLPLFAIIFTFLSVNICAQEKDKSSLNKKLSELKGKVEKITVQVEGKDVVFEGKEAQTLAKRMKTNGMVKTLNYSIGHTIKTPKVFTITGDDFDDAEEIEATEDDDTGIVLSVDSKDSLDENSKKIKFEKKGGKTKLTVTTKDENGKSVTKEYEGEEADKYLEENNMNTFHFSTKGKGRISAYGPGKFWLHRGKTPGKIYIEKSNSDDDEDSEAEITIQMSDKKANSGIDSIIVNKTKTKAKKSKKED
jgi:hypothetical protein